MAEVNKNSKWTQFNFYLFDFTVSFAFEAMKETWSKCGEFRREIDDSIYANQYLRLRLSNSYNCYKNKQISAFLQKISALECRSLQDTSLARSNSKYFVMVEYAFQKNKKDDKTLKATKFQIYGLQALRNSTCQNNAFLAEIKVCSIRH